MTVGPGRSGAFLALDPEPDPPSKRRRLTIALAVLTALLVAGGAFALPRLLHSASSPSNAAPKSGVLPNAVPVGIVAADGDRLDLLRPDGRARRLLSDQFIGFMSNLTTSSPPVRAYLSPDGSQLVNSSGFKIYLCRRAYSVPPTRSIPDSLSKGRSHRAPGRTVVRLSSSSNRRANQRCRCWSPR